MFFTSSNSPFESMMGRRSVCVEIPSSASRRLSSRRHEPGRMARSLPQKKKTSAVPILQSEESVAPQIHFLRCLKTVGRIWVVFCRRYLQAICKKQCYACLQAIHHHLPTVFFQPTTSAHLCISQGCLVKTVLSLFLRIRLLPSCCNKFYECRQCSLNTISLT